MAILYYSDTASYPQQVLAITGALKTYMAEQLYYNDSLADAKARFLVADQTDDASLREATKKFFDSNQKYPFTTYNIGDEEPVTDRRNSWAKSGKYYSSTYSCYIDAKPLKQTFPMISFFNNPHDYEHCKKILQNISDSAIKLDVPIVVNGISTTFTAEVKFQAIDKGGLAYEFIEYLTKNNIFNLMHNIEVYYHSFVINTDTNPIDTMNATVFQEDPEDDSLNTSVGSGLAPLTPALLSSIPTDESSGIAVGSGIVLTFNVGMNPDSVERNLDITPYFEHSKRWNEYYTQLTLTPWSDLSSGVAYTIDITQDWELYDSPIAIFNEEPIETDIEINFTTI